MGGLIDLIHGASGMRLSVIEVDERALARAAGSGEALDAAEIVEQ